MKLKERQPRIHDEPLAPDPVRAVAVTMVGKRPGADVARQDSVRDRCESAYLWESAGLRTAQKSGWP